VREDAPGELTVVFDAEANGSASRIDGTICPVNATLTDAQALVQYGTQVEAPAIDLFVDSFFTKLAPLQLGCGADADSAIAVAVADAFDEELRHQTELRLSGLAPHCSPDFPLPDGDEDGSVDCDDLCPSDPNKTDPGACGCGVVDDADGDGFAFCGFDCDDADATIWATPGEVRSVTLAGDDETGGTPVDWVTPLAPGGTLVLYDTLGSPAPDELALATCVESDDGADTQAILYAVPDPGEVLYVLVRAENGCVDGQGTLGFDSSGGERFGPACP
jgi:hypothetical protein